MSSSLLFRISRPTLKRICPNKICKNALFDSPTVCVGSDTNATRFLSSPAAVNTFQPPHTVLESSEHADKVAHTEDTADNNENSSAELKVIAEEITETSTESSEVAEDIKAEDNPYEGIPPEEVLRKGRFSWIE